ncbi:hypothetical protein S83_008617 [Arachis hypogaea]|uniref:Large ribosomal subunit protein bL32c n=15 Tax=50 kb inversion clade TaxID=2231393 RepID=A0A445DV34_ARAHY|nr:Photosystem I assembly protein [Arachis hypogaea]RYR67055.1 hypothetical protein Ahy_A03g013289 [Arachis hypogaea]
MAVPKKRTSRSKKKIRKTLWKRRGFWTALKAYSLAQSISTGNSKSFLMKDIQSIRIEVKEGISTRRILYMEIIGQGAIPLTRIDENLTSREIEQKAAELAYFLRVPIELL